MWDNIDTMWSFNQWRQAPHIRSSALLISATFLAVSCTSAEVSVGESDEQGGLGTIMENSTDPQIESGVQDVSEQQTEVVDLSLVTDPISDPLVYACNGVVATAEDLVAAFAAASQSESLVSESLVAERLAELGVVEASSSSWVLTDSGVLIDRTPLTQNPQSFLVSVNADSGLGACALRRAGFFSTRPIAWSIGDDGSTQIESCVTPEDVIVDSRSIDGVDVVTLFAPYDDVTGAAVQSCLVDGSVVLDIELPADALSGATFPFVESDPQTFQALGLGAFVVPAAVLDGPGTSCQTASGVAEVTVSWDTLPVGVSVEVISAGQHLGAIPSVRFEDSGEVVRARLERADTVGDASFDHSGFDFFVDVHAPRDAVRPYEIVLSAAGSDSVSVDCGSAGIDAFGTPGGVSTDINTDDLGAAATLFAQSSIGPYAYMTVQAVCAECGNETHHLAMVPGGTFNHQFSPSLDEQTAGTPGGILNPFGVHSLLDEAIAEGKTVTYTIDARVGVVTEYTIDGLGAVVTCFEVDTAPADLRDGATCNPEWDLIS